MINGKWLYIFFDYFLYILYQNIFININPELIITKREKEVYNEKV
jgi:hypothetical protein